MSSEGRKAPSSKPKEWSCWIHWQSRTSVLRPGARHAAGGTGAEQDCRQVAGGSTVLQTADLVQVVAPRAPAIRGGRASASGACALRVHIATQGNRGSKVNLQHSTGRKPTRLQVLDGDDI